MRKLLCHILVLAYLFFGIATSVSLKPRLYGSCVYLRRKIYCYGGIDHADEGKQGMDRITMNDFYYLDISGNFAVSNASSAWVEIHADGASQPEPNAFYSIGTVPANDTIVISGGIGKNDASLLVNPTMAYNVKENTWYALSGNSGLQGYGAGAAIGYNGTLYIWGGVSDGAIGYTFQEYQRDMRTLDFATNQWSQTNLYSTLPSRIWHTATLGNDKHTIYYIGGQAQIIQTADNGTSYYDKFPAPMSTILLFDTASGIWATRNTTGDNIPSTRYWHTAELKPNTNEIVVYGGSTQVNDTDTIAVEDFCCVLDTTSMSWTIVNLSRTEGAGIRVGHSAVFLEDSTLMFIMFGKGGNSDARMDVQVLDTDSWQWVQNYEGPGPLPGDEQGTGDSDGLNSKSLSGGAIAGIVVGIIAAVAIIGGALFFFKLRRRREQQADNNYYNNPTYGRNDIKSSDGNTPRSTYLGIQQQPSYQSSGQGLTSPPIQYAVHLNDGSTSPLSSNTGLHVTTTSTTVEKPTSGSESTKPDGSEGGQVSRMMLHPVKPDGSR